MPADRGKSLLECVLRPRERERTLSRAFEGRRERLQESMSTLRFSERVQRRRCRWREKEREREKEVDRPGDIRVQGREAGATMLDDVLIIRRVY